MKKYIKIIKKIWNKNPINIIIPIISILALIIGTIAIGFLKTFIILIILNAIAFVPSFIKINKKKKKTNIKTKTRSETRSSSTKKVTSKSNDSSNPKKKKKKKRILKKLLIIFFILVILGMLAVAGFFAYIVANAPHFEPELLYSTEPTVIYDKDGKEIAKLGAEQRVILDYDEIPEILIDAIVATEDSRFFQHNGVDWARFLKASAKQLTGSGGGGASTLTMQLSKNTYTSTEASGIKGIIRKFTDIYISMTQIEKNYSKQEIMEFYVNSYFLGYNSYGVEQASLTYFNKSAKDLNLAEAAMIAGLFQAPSKYDPYNNPEDTEARRQTVLKLMLRHEYITEEEYNIAKDMTVEKIVVPLEKSNYSATGVNKYQSFIDQVVTDVKEQTGLNPYTTSMKIYSTMDTDIQDHLTNIMNGESYDWENDVVQAGVAITNVKDGSIVALGGGRNLNASGTLNRATQIKRQIGSTAKPLYDYGPAIEYLNWSPASPIVDEQITYSDGTPINNWDGKFQGFTTMRNALVVSRNIPALKAFKANNKSNIVKFTTSVGLTPEVYSCKDGYKLDGKKCISKDDPDVVVEANKASTLHEAHSIGGYTGENPLSMAAAYASFANGGYYIKPYAYTKVIITESGEEYNTKIQKEKAMSEETAYIVSDMLVDTAKYALGRYANINGKVYGAKTGTTNYDDKTLKALGLTYTSAVNDLWVVGMNTEYALGVWYGYDKNSSKYYNKLSSSQNSRLFQAVGKKIFTSTKSFTRPSGVVSVEIELENPVPTLPSEYTPSNLRKTELFVSGTEPTTVSTRFAKLQDVSNLNWKVADGGIELSWNKIKTPEMDTEDYLKKYYANTFSNAGTFNGFISSRLSYIKNNMGELGYSIYEKTNSGLNLIAFTTDDSYILTPSYSGEHTYVVKSSYSKFKSNMSDGKTISMSISVSSDPSTDEDDEDTDNNENSQNQNTQQGNTTLP